MAAFVEGYGAVEQQVQAQMLCAVQITAHGCSKYAAKTRHCMFLTTCPAQLLLKKPPAVLQCRQLPLGRSPVCLQYLNSKGMQETH